MVDGPEMDADKSELNAVYDQYKDLENNDYTEDSWNEFQGALENAKNVLGDETADQDAVNEAKAKLEAAVAGLTKQSGFSGGSHSPSSGWIQLRNGNWKYRGEHGRFVTGWQKVKNIWYYMDDHGIMLTGWQKINGVWYYLKDWGGMATGWQKINGTWYYLKSWGGMAAGTTTPDGYQVDWNGAWIRA